MSTTSRTVGARRRPATTVASAIGVGALLVTTLAACQETGPGAGDFITGAEVVGQSAEVSVRSERFSEGSGGGPEVSVEGEAVVINGGSQLVTLSSSQEFTSVLVGIQTVPGATYAGEEDAPDPGPLPGHYNIALAQPATEVELVLNMASQLPADIFQFDYAVADAGGQQGPTTAQDVSSIVVGTGEVQVSVAWDAASDVDLYVVDPAGDEIFWAQTSSASGGQLDLDSNSGCTIDNTNNENITWAESAPPGTYEVRVNYWASCDVDSTRYVVTVRVGGQAPQTFHGEFTGEGSGGDRGAGEVVTTFTVE